VVTPSGLKLKNLKTQKLRFPEPLVGNYSSPYRGRLGGGLL
jgi:hypothetical protein